MDAGTRGRAPSGAKENVGFPRPVGDCRLATVSVLRLEIAGFAALQAVVGAVLAETNVMGALAEHAIAIALAVGFGLVAKGTAKLFRHGRAL
jgi:hypothetical protein